MILLVLWLVFTSPLVNGGYVCPLSSKMHLNTTNSYFYPVDIYAPFSVFASTREQNQLFNCSAFDILTEVRQHQCSTKVKFCPIHSENVRDASALSVNSRSSLCHLQDKLANKRNHIRLFVMGGSATAGSKAGGCAADAQHQYVNSRCAWPYHFGQWLKTTSAAQVTTYNLGTGGHNSYLRSRTFPSDLSRLGITSFTEDDVIFVDHSINDNVGRQSEVERGVESLIRRVYSLSENNSWPSIILLDSDAQMCHRPTVKAVKTLVYPLVYESMAKLYNLSLWSYRRAVWSPYSLLAQRNYSDYINFNNNHCDIHPTWHVHLFMADLYAAIFQSQLAQCTQKQVKAAVTLHSQPLLLPPPHSLLQVHTECTTALAPFISLSYNDIQSNYSVSGTYSVNPRDSWQLREDKKGSGGFIVEIKNINETLRRKDSTKLRLTFTSSVSTESILRSKHPLVNVQILYLRSYENAGVVAVYFCGERHERPLDALWNDYRTNRISIPEIREGLLNLKTCVSNNFTHPTVEFVHQPVRGLLETRKNQKFKLLSIKMCRDK